MQQKNLCKNCKTEVRGGLWNYDKDGFCDDCRLEYSGFVDAEHYIEFKKEGKPSSWCGDTNAMKVSNETMEYFIKNNKAQNCETLVNWWKKGEL